MDGHDVHPSSPGAFAGRRLEVTVPRRLLIPLLSALVALGGAACSASGGVAAPDPASPGPPMPIRTVVVFGPDDMLVAEIVEVGGDARATVRTPAGLYGEEVLVGEDHYVRMPDAGAFLGTDRWIHTDLRDPRQRRYFEENPAGLIDLAELTALGVGDEIAGHEVRSVEHADDDTVRIDLGLGRTIDVTTVTVDDREAVLAPDPSEVIALADLPESVRNRG